MNRGIIGTIIGILVIIILVIVIMQLTWDRRWPEIDLGSGPAWPLAAAFW